MTTFCREKLQHRVDVPAAGLTQLAGGPMAMEILAVLEQAAALLQVDLPYYA